MGDKAKVGFGNSFTEGPSCKTLTLIIQLTHDIFMSDR